MTCARLSRTLLTSMIKIWCLTSHFWWFPLLYRLRPVQELREDLLLRSEVQHLLVEKWDPKVEARSWDVRSSRHLRATCEL